MKRVSVSKEELDNFIDIEKQQHYLNTFRYSEGEDTITPYDQLFLL